MSSAPNSQMTKDEIAALRATGDPEQLSPDLFRALCDLALKGLCGPSDHAGLIATLETMADQGSMIHCLSWVAIQGTLRKAADALKNAAPPASEDVKPDMALPCATSADRNSRPDHGIGEQTGTNRATQARASSEAGADDARDAARYRFIRDRSDPDMEQPYITRHKVNSWGKWFNTCDKGDYADRVIDAEMSKSNATEGGTK